MHYRIARGVARATVIWIATAFLLCAQQAWDRALQLHQAGDLTGAAAAYREVLAADPGRYDARSNLGAVLSAQGRYEEAVEQYRQALKSAPAQYAPQLRQNLGLAFYKAGEFSDAIAAFLELHQAQPKDQKIELLLADSYLQDGEPAEAAAVLGSLDASQDRAVAYLLGTALIRSGQVERGQKVIDTILRDGDTAESRFLIGAAMFEAHDYPKAVQEFASAIALNPDLPRLSSFYGQALLNTGDADAAAAAFRKELAGNPNDFDSNLRLGEILENRGDIAGAAPLFENAARLRPRSLDAQEDLASLDLDRHEYAKAEGVLASIIQKSPEAARAHALLARAYEGLGKTSLAQSERLKGGDGQRDPGPNVGDAAPPFSLPELNSKKMLSLESFRAGKPVVVLFGSYTCPNFREQAPALNALAEKYGRDVPFLLVYIREAHAGDNWQSTINQREGIDWQAAKTLPEMQLHATSCVRKLKMNFRAVVDGVDGAVESQYSAWPSRLFVIGRDGRVLYRTRLGDLDFHADAVEAAIRSAQ